MIDSPEMTEEKKEAGSVEDRLDKLEMVAAALSMNSLAVNLKDDLVKKLLVDLNNRLEKLEGMHK